MIDIYHVPDVRTSRFCHNISTSQTSTLRSKCSVRNFLLNFFGQLNVLTMQIVCCSHLNDLELSMSFRRGSTLMQLNGIWGLNHVWRNILILLENPAAFMSIAAIMFAGWTRRRVFVPISPSHCSPVDIYDSTLLLLRANSTSATCRWTPATVLQPIRSSQQSLPPTWILNILQQTIMFVIDNLHSASSAA